ncbi:MAG: hypothetical protein IJK60_10045 [Clostridia bacterium]|nr:hypothetical protein [Clostridia bacterium]
MTELNSCRVSAPKMRTAEQAIEELKRVDPETALTVRAVRRMISTGEIPFVRVGNKFLFDFNVLCDYLSGGSQTVSTQSTENRSGNIRRILR